MDKPSVKIDYVRAVDQDKLFFNWTLDDWNSPVTDYFLAVSTINNQAKFSKSNIHVSFYRLFKQSRQSGHDSWEFFLSERIPVRANSFVMKNLVPNATYHIKLAAKNTFGMGEYDLFHKPVRTLDFDPVFVPTVGVKGLTWNSISIGWNAPDDERLSEHIDYYKLNRKTSEQELTMYHPSKDYPFYLWRNLEPATNYSFTVAACNQYTRECGNPSNSVSAATEDGLSGPPAFVELFCKHDNISSMNFVEVKWREPKHKFGKIEFYNVSLKSKIEIQVFV